MTCHAKRRWGGLCAAVLLSLNSTNARAPCRLPGAPSLPLSILASALYPDRSRGESGRRNAKVKGEAGAGARRRPKKKKNLKNHLFFSLREREKRNFFFPLTGPRSKWAPREAGLEVVGPFNFHPRRQNLMSKTACAIGMGAKSVAERTRRQGLKEKSLVGRSGGGHRRFSPSPTSAATGAKNLSLTFFPFFFSFLFNLKTETHLIYGGPPHDRRRRGGRASRSGGRSSGRSALLEPAPLGGGAAAASRVPPPPRRRRL